MRRLSVIADSLRPCETVADIGCDHGLLSATILDRGIARRAIACDISAPSLAKADRLARERGLAIETRLGDGLLPIRAREADAAVIAGMGGYEILHILSDPRRTDGITSFVVSPQSDLKVFRGALNGLGLAIIQEKVVQEGKHFYFVMNLEAGRREYSSLELEFGLAICAPDAGFRAYLEWSERLIESKLRRFGNIEDLISALGRVREAMAKIGIERKE